MRAFADLNASAHLQLIRDRFIAVDIWIVWDRALLSVISWTVAVCGRVMPRTWTVGELVPNPERPQPVYRVDDIQPECQPEVSLEDQDMLDLLM